MILRRYARCVAGNRQTAFPLAPTVECGVAHTVQNIAQDTLDTKNIIDPSRVCAHARVGIERSYLSNVSTSPVFHTNAWSNFACPPHAPLAAQK
jgi:hypothetical protein